MARRAPPDGRHKRSFRRDLRGCLVLVGHRLWPGGSFCCGGSFRRDRWRSSGRDPDGCCPLGRRLVARQAAAIQTAAAGPCRGHARRHTGRTGFRSAAGAERACLRPGGHGIGAKAARSARAMGVPRCRGPGAGAGSNGHHQGPGTTSGGLLGRHRDCCRPWLVAALGTRTPTRKSGGSSGFRSRSDRRVVSRLAFLATYALRACPLPHSAVPEARPERRAANLRSCPQ